VSRLCVKNKNVTPVWEDKYMQNRLRFHPILDLPTLEEENISVYVDGNNQMFNRGAPHELVKARESRVEYRFRRVLVGVTLIILGAFLWTVFALVTGLNDQSVGADLSPDAPREIYTVQSGDTLWSIAMGIDADGDPRDTVDRLAALNGGSALYIGQKLILSN
tara:strand:+ start:626 stop:1114 length:489 start_codon:yes stop_codon:yes gene_type:complete